MLTDCASGAVAEIRYESKLLVWDLDDELTDYDSRAVAEKRYERKPLAWDIKMSSNYHLFHCTLIGINVFFQFSCVNVWSTLKREEPWKVNYTSSSIHIIQLNLKQNWAANHIPHFSINHHNIYWENNSPVSIYVHKVTNVPTNIITVNNPRRTKYPY